MMKRNSLLCRNTLCEPRNFLAAAVFEPESDPDVGTNITTFVSELAGTESSKIASSWISSAKEAAEAGLSEVTFAVTRKVDSKGNISGGPAIKSVAAAVEAANEFGLDVNIFPLFETASGWRGDYDPTGAERTTFRSDYVELITDLASIDGITRLNFASEMDAMIENEANREFFEGLIGIAKEELAENGNEATRVGFATTLDSIADDRDANKDLARLEDVDFVGISLYAKLFGADEAGMVAGTAPVSDDVQDEMVKRWEAILDEVAEFGDESGVNLLIQEFGAPAENYASLAPFSVDPGSQVAQWLPNRNVVDTNEQVALYETLLEALDGRGDEFESINFWTWENGVSQNPRTNGSDVDNPEVFAISPDDGAAGEALVKFLESAE